MNTKLIFVHIPRTAGTSICRFFGIVNNHDTAGQIYERDPVLWARAFTFGIVRNPWDRAVSYWSRLCARGLTTETLSEWVKNGMDPAWAGATHPMATDKFLERDGVLLVDYLGKYEELVNSVRYVARCVNFPRGRVLPHIRKTEHEHYSRYYDCDSRKIIADTCKWEIERFNYQFEEEK